ncbi:MAG: FAD-dependent oxidoreductase [Verrucomicrobia bacterium]|jgi:sarcosine oxidase|nr:FAD-dependent oxidoreductase [Verrucomicrobiota bacterium]MDB4746138.1 FAD-dependent oxidoreductase [Verrucomicrobiota bacterium]
MTNVDYVVVGGGITGVCAAYHLAKKGADVLLIERGELAPDSPISSSGEHAKAFRSVYGKDRAMTRLCRESFKHWRHFEQETGAELFVPSGMIVFGADQAQTLKHWADPNLARFAVDSAPILKEEGLSHELLCKSELVERYPQIEENDFYDHAILDKTAGFISARESVRKIGSLAEKEGAVLWDHTAVEKVVRAGERVEHLVTARGDVTPKKAVIFAAGYMNGEFAPELVAKTRVTQHQILYLKPRDPAPYSPKKMPILIDINQWRYVFPIHGPGITKVVDDDNDSNEKVIDPKQRFDVGRDEGFRADAMSFLKKFIPGLVDSDEVDRSTCRYTNTVRQKYLIYRKANSVVLSACSGHGFKNAPMTALMAVKLAEGQDQVPSDLDREFGYENAENFDLI